MNLHEQFRKDIKSIITNIDTIDTYTEDTKIDQEFRFICLYCENEYTETIHRTLMGYGCPTCKKKPRTDVGQSPRVFKIRMKYIHPNLKIDGEYKGSKGALKCQCLIDGHVFNSSASSLLRGYGCAKCSKNMKYDTNSFKEALSKVNGNIEVIGEYVNSHTNTKFRCKIDGYTWMARPGNVLHGAGCHKCANAPRYTDTTYKEKVYSIHKNIEVISDYKGHEENVKCRCKIDGYTWEIKAVRLFNQGCPKCSKKIRYTEDIFLSELRKNHKNIEIIRPFVSVKEPVRCRCLLDNEEWEILPRNLIRGVGCPKCYRLNKGLASNGELMTYKYFDSNGIEYSVEKSFSELTGVRGIKLRYDLYFEIEGHAVIIEYQGIQHYYRSGLNNERYNFEYRKSTDVKKRLFAISKNMYFIEIPYLIDSQQDVDYFLNFHLRRILMNCSELEVVPRVVIDMIIKAQDLGHKIDTLKALTSWIHSAEEVSDDLYLIRYKNSIFEDYDRTEELTLDEFIARYKISDKN